MQHTALDAKLLLGDDVQVFVVDDACQGLDDAAVLDVFAKLESEKVQSTRLGWVTPPKHVTQSHPPPLPRAAD